MATEFFVLRHRARLGAWLILPLSLALAACGSASEIQSVPSGSLVVDVRTPAEYAEWHYPGAVNAPVETLAQSFGKLGDKQRTIVVYCRSGNRSATAKELLLSQGFEDVKNGGGLRDMKSMLPQFD